MNHLCFLLAVRPYIGNACRRDCIHGYGRKPLAMSTSHHPEWLHLHDLHPSSGVCSLHILEHSTPRLAGDVLRVCTLCSAHRTDRSGAALYQHPLWLSQDDRASDGLIGKITRHSIFLFRKLDHDGSSPVCSGVTAFVYDKALHYRFGVEPECADPDHIHDWVVAHPEEWQRVFVLNDWAVPSAQSHQSLPMIKPWRHTASKVGSYWARQAPSTDATASSRSNEQTSGALLG